MGYRSTVSIFLEEPKDMKLEDIISSSRKAENYGKFTIGTNSDNKRVLLAIFNYCKWYPDYALVNFWEDILSNVDEDTYLFTRVGEDYGDYETHGNYGYSYATTITEFDIDFNGDIPEHIGYNIN